jgi:hypothetical protein
MFTQAAIAPDPGDRAFDHPPARQHREGRHGGRLHIDRIPTPAARALDDLQGPAALFFHLCAEPLAAIRHVRPDVLQALAAIIGGRQEPWRHVRIPQVRGVDKGAQEETRRINEEMALAAIEFLGAIIAMRPPFSVVFTVWASMTAADGCG